MTNRTEIIENLQNVVNTGLGEKLNMSNDEWMALIAEDESLAHLLSAEESQSLDLLPLSRFLTIPLTEMNKTLEGVSLSKRISLLNELEERLAYLYKQAAKYGEEGIPKEDAITPKDFVIIMGKIKHSEILAACLYGI